MTPKSAMAQLFEQYQAMPATSAQEAQKKAQLRHKLEPWIEVDAKGNETFRETPK